MLLALLGRGACSTGDRREHGAALHDPAVFELAPNAALYDDVSSQYRAAEQQVE